MTLVRHPLTPVSVAVVQSSEMIEAVATNSDGWRCLGVQVFWLTLTS